MKPIAVLLAIRLAMMAGVLLFGGVSWFLHRAPGWEPSGPALIESLSVVGRFVWIIVGLALIALYVMRRNSADVARAAQFSIFSWSLGELLALYGGVVFYLTAVSSWYVAGVIALAITLVAIQPPVPR